MIVIKNQQLWFDTALSYRVRLEKSSLVSMIAHIKSNIEVLGFELTDDIVFSIYEEISEKEKTILGVEFIVPIDRPFESNCHYVFKPNFKLENALLLKFCGRTSELLDVRKKLWEYVLNNNVTALTNVYYSVKQLSDESIVANAYLGISGNSL